MNLPLLFDWPALVFILPAGVAVLLLGLYLLAGIDAGDFGGDAGGADGGDVVDLDPDLSVALHLEPAGADYEAGGAGGNDAGPSAVGKALELLGFGHVPSSVVVFILCITWGFVGFVTVAWFVRSGRDPAAALPVAVPLALVASLAAGASLSRLVGRVLPMNESFGVYRAELVGSFGEAATPIGRDYGRVVVRDRHGDRHDIACRVAPDADVIAAGGHVVVVRYCRDAGFYYVVAASWWDDYSRNRNLANSSGTSDI